MASSPEIQEIKDKLDVVDFLGEYLKLTPAGINAYKANCPFHNEKTPSLMVSRARQSWHCFGCGVGGDIFEFLMKMENVDFSEAIKILAQKAGVTLSRQNKEQSSKKNRLYDICELTARYWHKILLESSRAEEVREYLKTRGLSEDSIEKFRIGYSIDEWDNLYNFLSKRGYKPDEIFSSGLSIKRERGSGFYDRFRHRVMFPIIDQNGRVCGFTGRALKKEEPAKYINSPQTEIYNKSLIVFALYQSRDEIRKQDAAVIVEGQMDAVSCHQYGFKNTVASSGTALTIEQFKLIKRYTNNVYLALDADMAGIDANSRGEILVKSIENSSKIIEATDPSGKLSKFIDKNSSSNFNLKIVTIPYGKDPDECLKHNPDDWKTAIENAKHPMEYYWDILIKDNNLDDLETKKKIAKFYAEKISNYLDPVEKDYWISRISSRLQIREDSLRELAQRFLNASRANVVPKTGSPDGSNLTPKGRSEAVSPQNSITSRDLLVFRRILALIWAFPEFLAKLPETLSVEMITDELSQGIYKDLILFYTKHNELFTLGAGEREEQKIFDQFLLSVINHGANTPAIKLLEQSYLLAQRDFFALSIKEARSELDQLLGIIKVSYLNFAVSRLKFELEQAELSGDKELAEKKFLELSQMIKRKLV